MWAILEW